MVRKSDLASISTSQLVTRVYYPDRPERPGSELIAAVSPLLGAKIDEFLRLRGR